MSQASFWRNENLYGLDVRCLEEFANTDNFAQPVVGYFNPAVLLTTETAQRSFNFTNCTLEDLQKFEIPFSFEVSKTGALHAWLLVLLPPATHHLPVAYHQRCCTAWLAGSTSPSMEAKPASSLTRRLLPRALTGTRHGCCSRSLLPSTAPSVCRAR